MAETVTCIKKCYFYIDSKEVDKYTEREGGLKPDSDFIPSDHMPYYDSDVYTSYKITYEGEDCTNDILISCPHFDFTVYYYFYGESGGDSGGGSAEEPENPENPNNNKWNWAKSNGRATASQTEAAYNAVIGQGKVSDFSYLVWNDMVDKVMNTINEKNDTKGWIEKYASYEDTRMTKNDKTLTAKRFNSLRYNIGYRYSTDIKEVNTGDEVYGWYFTTLADCLNLWIGE